jgi:hypothetical protein
MLTTIPFDIAVDCPRNQNDKALQQASVKRLLTTQGTGLRTSLYQAGNALTTANVATMMPAWETGILGWTPDEALETRSRLLVFAEDWDAAGMEAYDGL